MCSPVKIGRVPRCKGKNVVRPARFGPRFVESCRNYYTKFKNLARAIIPVFEKCVQLNGARPKFDVRSATHEMLIDNYVMERARLVYFTEQ